MVVRVTLLAYSQWNPEIWPEDRKENPEHIMATGKRICQTDAGLVTIINETDQIKERVVDAVKKRHFGVLEHVTFTFLIEGISRIESHQHVRHRMASYLQMSQRTVDASKLDMIMPPEVNMMYLTEDLEEDIKKLEALSRDVYARLQKQNIEREDARYYLLHGMETRIWMTVNGSALMHFLRLRLGKHAQWEIKEIAKQMYELVKKVCPNTFSEDLREYLE